MSADDVADSGKESRQVSRSRSHRSLAARPPCEANAHGARRSICSQPRTNFLKAWLPSSAPVFLLARLTELQMLVS